MRLYLLLKAVILSTLFLYISEAHAQSFITYTSNDSIAVHNAIVLYQQALFPQTGLYNGGEYVDYSYTIKEGTPFFESPDFTTGSLVYDHILYEHVPLLYDEVKDEVVISDPYQRSKIKLISERVSGFSILNHSFIRLIEDSTDKSVIHTGFYEVLYNGNTSIYKKQIKKVQETTSVIEGLKRFIDETNDYFIKKGNTFFPVSSKGSVLNVIQDKKKEIQQFIKKNNLNLRKDKDNALIQIASYYNEITK